MAIDADVLSAGFRRPAVRRSFLRYALDCRGHREFGNIHELMESRYGRFT